MRRDHQVSRRSDAFRNVYKRSRVTAAWVVVAASARREASANPATRSFYPPAERDGAPVADAGARSRCDSRPARLAAHSRRRG